MPTLLLTKDFDGEATTVALTTHDAGWEYAGAADRYEVHPADAGTPPGGYAFGGSTTPSDSIASHDYDVPVGTSVRLDADIQRGAVDAVGGGIEFQLYYRDAARGTVDQTDRLQFLVRRVSAGAIQLSAVWFKAAAESPPLVVLASVEVSHIGLGQRRYSIEADESTLEVRLYASDFSTGSNSSLLASGSLPVDLTEHGAGDRHIGFGTLSVAGLVSFRLYHLEVWDLEVAPLVTGEPCSVLLQCFEDDTVAVLWEVATNPAHPFPYLVQPDQLGEQEVDFARGAASLGTVRWAIADKNLVVGDQDSGFLTGKLAAFGIPALGGKRMRMIRFVPDGVGYQVLADGPSSQPRMAPDYSSFEGEIRDTREIERKVRMFDLVSESGTAAISGALPSATEQTGTDPSYTWGTLYH